MLNNKEKPSNASLSRMFTQRRSDFLISGENL